MKSKSLKIAIIFGVFFVSLFISAKISLAFDDLTTHPALTDEIVDFHNLFSGHKITSEEKELIVSGAMGEDIPPRWINHFYDPIRNIGWTGRNTGVWPTSLVRYFSGTVLSSAYPVSSLNWLHNQELQTYYKMYKGNRTWERAVYEYANGNPQEALYTLGYILHLIEDAAVPDHTRDDPHAHDMRLATGDYGSPLEEYAKRYNRNNFNIADELKNNDYKPIALSGVDDYLVSLAKYSNGYFFSKDTINDPIYQNPKIIEEDGKFGYGLDKNGEKFAITKVKTRWDEINKEYLRNFELKSDEEEYRPILSQYFTRLSREAIIHGAGVIDLFFKETEDIILGQKQAPKLFTEEPKSIVQRIVTLDAGLGNVSATGEFFKIVNLIASAYNKAKETVADFAVGVVNLFSQKPNNELSAVLEAINLNNSENNTYSNSSASDTSSNVSYEIYQENITPIDDGQSAELTATKFKQAEESLQVLQNQILALENQPPSRTVLDGGGSFASSSISSFAPMELIQPKFVATTYYPGFGGGGDGEVAINSTSDSSSSGAEASSSSSLSAEEAGSLSSSDTDPPTISSFFIAECQTSLSSDGCLVATTTLNIAWNSLSDDLDYFIVNKNGAVSTTTSTSTVATVSDNSFFSFVVSAKDFAGNESAASAQTVEISTMPVVINEVAWAGNGAAYSADEWIELHNRTSLTVDLSSFILYSKTDSGPYINLNGTIAPKNYYLIERTNDNTVSDIAADLTSSFGSGLSNAGENIAMVYKLADQATTTIDEIPKDTNWYAGSSFNYSTMERYDADIVGANPSNWGTNNSIIKNGKNAGGGNVNGTPKARNSANYLIAKGVSPVSSSVILTKSNSPYLVNNYVQVFNASSTLTVEPGVVIKFYNSAGWHFIAGAKILAQGTVSNPIIFTSFYDDTYGGDTNGDTASTLPSVGDWFGVRIDSPGVESIISNNIFRYGGKYYNGGPWTDSKANLYISNSSVNISDSIFEYSKVYGLKMIYSNSSISGSVFRNNNNVLDIAGYDSSLLAIGGSPSLARNSFVSNHRGAYFFNSPAAVDSNTFTFNTGEAIYSYGQLGSYSNNSGSSNGIDAISLSGTITQNGATTTLAANSLPYLLSGRVTVAASSTLAVNSGLVIKGWNVRYTSYLGIYGNLIVSGANFSDIIFGSMFSSPAKSNWGGVRFYSGSQSAISGATFEYADTAIAYTGSPISLSNVKFNENNLGVSADTASLTYPINVSDIIFTGNIATTSPRGLW